MSLIPRMIVGRRGNETGVWMSRRGVDVRTAGKNDLLISPTDPNLSFLLNGIVTLAPSKTTTVLFGAVLHKPPLVLPQMSYKGESFIPSVQHAIESSALREQHVPPRFDVTSFVSSFRMRNRKAITFQVRFLVLKIPA